MDGNSITPMDALDMFGVFRLAGKWKEFISDYTADDKRHKNI